jgi:hypothetical protein
MAGGISDRETDSSHAVQAQIAAGITDMAVYWPRGRAFPFLQTLVTDRAKLTLSNAPQPVWKRDAPNIDRPPGVVRDHLPGSLFLVVRVVTHQRYSLDTSLGSTCGHTFRTTSYLRDNFDTNSAGSRGRAQHRLC